MSHGKLWRVQKMQRLEGDSVFSTVFAQRAQSMQGTPEVRMQHANSGERDNLVGFFWTGEGGPRRLSAEQLREQLPAGVGGPGCGTSLNRTVRSSQNVLIFSSYVTQHTSPDGFAWSFYSLGHYDLKGALFLLPFGLETRL